MSERGFSRRPSGLRLPLVRRFLPALAAAAAAAAVLVPAGGADTVLPTLYFRYTNNCTFSISDDSGRAVTQIVPGSYQVFVMTPVVFAGVDLTGVFDMTACKGYVQFQLTGPGVNIQTTLQDGDEDKDLERATFQPGSTYVALDNNQPGVTRTTFTTAASGSATGPTGSSTSSVSGGSSQQSLVGSAANPFRGALDAIVYASGKLSLTRNGKPVTTLKTGRWTFSVDDESRKAGFSLQVLRGKAMTITSPTYTGSHDATVELKPGRWAFFTPAGKRTTFFVGS